MVKNNSVILLNDDMRKSGFIKQLVNFNVVEDSNESSLVDKKVYENDIRLLENTINDDIKVFYSISNNFIEYIKDKDEKNNLNYHLRDLNSYVSQAVNKTFGIRFRVDIYTFNIYRIKDNVYIKISLLDDDEPTKTVYLCIVDNKFDSLFAVKECKNNSKDIKNKDFIKSFNLNQNEYLKLTEVFIRNILYLYKAIK